VADNCSLGGRLIAQAGQAKRLHLMYLIQIIAIFYSEL